ncbi:MAG: GMC family oxidoreductase N-terminal domain-containing protein [Candidatus Aminicenantes bacterium]|nr:GMC family oxidoreductase N-terminal domain-containing protein [Candidatus Aminicenantes bacterium]
MKKAIVIGSGAAGATVARELQGKFDVTVLEAGKPFRPFPYSLTMLESLRKSGLFFDEREIRWLFPTMQIRKTSEKMVLVNGIGTGGTTTISTGNALRMDLDLKKLGIDLSDEFDQIIKEIPVSTAHQKHWKKTTRQLFNTCEEMDLNPQPTPKMGNYEHCKHCGRCIFGCPLGVKWDSRQFLQDAVTWGAKLVTGCRVKKIIIENGKAKGVAAGKRFISRFFPADVIILCAGGLGTPVILQNSGIDCQPGLFVDPVLCVATERPRAFQNKEVAMPFVVQQDHFMISPYFDYLSFFFNRDWRKPARNILSLMIKLADSETGDISGKKVNKILSDQDKKHLQQAVDLCSEILGKLGVKKQDLFLGTLNAGHPGGMFPLTEKEAETFHHSALPDNLYIADATLIPKSLGNPPILTIIAIAKRVSQRIMH